MTAWVASPYTGLFTAFDRLDAEPHDPAIVMYAGTLARRGAHAAATLVGGAGWRASDARAACVGEAIERCEGWLRAADGAIEATYAAWPRDEPAIAPSAFALFSEPQYARDGFPFARLTERTCTRWVALRDAIDGSPAWVPDAFVALAAAPGEGHGVAPLISTGLAAGVAGTHPVVLRGVQEVIERDALVRAWWGELALEALDPDEAFAQLGAPIARRARRPHLAFRFLRIATPFAAHATLVTVSGEEPEGFVLGTGAAVRETRAESLEKALLEALQGRAYVRHQRARVEPELADRLPRDFSEHVLYYTLRPERLADTVLGRPCAAEDRAERARVEGLDALAERLPARPLFRLMTPPFAARLAPDLAVVKVVVPGLVPLHAHHLLAHLGAPFWRDRDLAAWLAHPPHPFA
ncbi:MAG: YcaO-like family protein [Sandaracinaceae bacterium]|nr:YcaO-like family protein [Sandaracinaceae bacterium]